MPRKSTLLAFSLLLFLTGCTCGPSYLTRTVDDWQNKDYVENPVRAGVISDILPGYFLLKVLAAIPDYLILNPVQFWAVDIWKGKGVGFSHQNPETREDPWFAKELGIQKSGS